MGSCVTRLKNGAIKARRVTHRQTAISFIQCRPLIKSRAFIIVSIKLTFTKLNLKRKVFLSSVTYETFRKLRRRSIVINRFSVEEEKLISTDVEAKLKKAF